MLRGDAIATYPTARPLVSASLHDVMSAPVAPHAPLIDVCSPGARTVGDGWLHQVPWQSPTTTVVLVSFTTSPLLLFTGSVGSKEPQPELTRTTPPPMNAVPSTPTNPSATTLRTRARPLGGAACHHCQPAGTGGHAGSGCQPSGGAQPGGGAGHPAGARQRQSVAMAPRMPHHQRRQRDAQAHRATHCILRHRNRRTRGASQPSECGACSCWSRSATCHGSMGGDRPRLRAVGPSTTCERASRGSEAARHSREPARRSGATELGCRSPTAARGEVSRRPRRHVFDARPGPGVQVPIPRPAPSL